MILTHSSKHKLLLSACIIFTISALLTILLMISNSPFSFVIVPLIICVACLVIFSAYGAYLLFRSFNFSRDQRLDETTPLLERRESLELGISRTSDFSGVTTEGSGRKKSSPRPTPKVRSPYQHPTPMPKDYLTHIFMSRFKVLGDFIRSRRHTVSESDVIDLDNTSADYLQSVRVHTMSESEMESQPKRLNPSLEAEGLFKIDLANDDYKGYKSC